MKLEACASARTIPSVHTRFELIRIEFANQFYMVCTFMARPGPFVRAIVNSAIEFQA